jgi:deoxyribodipyrimidine photolyase-related protein
LYWDFIARHEARFAKNTRMALTLRNWRARSDADKAAIRARAAEILVRLRKGDRI